MKKHFRNAPACLILSILLAVLFIASAAAEQTVRLPESRFALMIPDGMEYDGPGDSPDDARFAYVSAAMGLEIQFFCEPNEKGASLQAMAEVLAGDGVPTEIHRIGGIEMICYRTSDPGDAPEAGMKCIGYIFADGNKVQMICFWYANQQAADRTAEIIASITNGD